MKHTIQYLNFNIMLNYSRLKMFYGENDGKNKVVNIKKISKALYISGQNDMIQLYNQCLESSS